MATKRRPTEMSWDSDDELLNEDTAGIYAFPEEKDEEVDEDALLASDDDPDEQVTSQHEGLDYKDVGEAGHYKASEQVYEEEQHHFDEEVHQEHYEEEEHHFEDELAIEPALEIMADGDDLLEEESYEDVLEENSIAPQLGVSQSDGVQQYEEEQQGEEALNAHHVDRDNQTNQVGDVSQSYSSQEVEADTTVPDSESDSEEDEDDSKARGRFKSERSDIMSVPSARSKKDIPDKLEITKEEEDKINKFQQNQRTNRNQRRAQHFPGKRGGHQQHQKNQHNFQQRGLRQQFRPQNNAGLRMMQQGQRQLCMPDMLFRNNSPVSILDQPLRLVFQPPNQLRFSQANVPSQNMMGAPIIQQPLMQQQQQQPCLLRMTSEQNIHFNPRFQSAVSRPPDVRLAWQSSQSQCAPTQSSPLRPMFNVPRPNLEQKQFQSPPRMSEPWNQNRGPVLREQHPASLMSQSQLGTHPSLTTSQPIQPFNNIQQPMFPKQSSLQLLQDQDERVQQPPFGRGAPPQLMAPPTMDQVPPQQRFPNQRPSLPRAPSNFNHNQNRFPNMVNREPLGQPIQTLVNKRSGALGQVRIGQQQNLKGPRPPGIRPHQQQLTPGIRPPGVVQPTRPSAPVQPSQQQIQKQPPPKPMTEAEKEEIQKKIKRAQRFAQPAPVMAGVTKKIILGKRLSTDNSEASLPKTLKPVQTEMTVKRIAIKTEPQVEKKAEDALNIADPELDVYLDEEKERMERMKQLAEQIKEQKRKRRLMRAKQAAQQKAVVQQQQIEPSVKLEKTGLQSKPTQQSQTTDVPIPTMMTPSTQAALKNIPVGGVAKLPDGQWRKKVRVRDARSGAIKIKFFKITEEEAKRVISSGSARNKIASQTVTPTGQEPNVGQGPFRGQEPNVGQGPLRSQDSAIRVISTNIATPNQISNPVRPRNMPSQFNQNPRIVNQPSQQIPLLMSQDTQHKPEPRRFVKRPGQGLPQNTAIRQPLSLSNSRTGEQANLDKQRRVVLSSTATDVSDLSMSTVTIDGLSAGTTENKIRQLALKVGPIIACQMDRVSKRAIVQFCRSQHASLFVNKYNRTMLDLTMINVSFLDTN